MIKEILKTCPKCNEEFNAYSKWGNKKFCSKSCGNSRGPRTTEFKKAISEKLTGRIGHPNPLKGKYLVDRITKTCPCCGVKFETISTEPKKYCSKKCRTLNAGGYREGSGRAKTGYFKGMYCGSTYELVWAIYQIDHSIKFSRFPSVLEKDGIKYYPDFLVGNTIVEIKGYEAQESVDKKTKVAESYGYNVSVLRKEDLENEFNWVKQNYQYKELYQLYDDYKPKYNLICSNCGNSFYRNSKPKTEIVFCKRFCAGTGHKGRKVPID